MQGLESLNQFKNFMSSVGGLGRYEDTYMIHAAEGETVVPMEVLDRNPLLKERLFESMRDMGIEPERYIVGNNLNSLNPLTGQPEFFLKRLKKAIADVSGYASPIIGAMYGPAAGAAAGAAMGAFKRENPGDPSQWAQMGMLGGGTGLAANYLSGQPLMQWGGGIKGAGGLGQFLTGSGQVVGPSGPMMPTKGLFGSAGKFGLGQGTIADLASKLSGGKELSPIEIVNSADYKRMVAAGVDPDIAYKEVKSKSGKDNLLLKGLLGIGGTLGLGKLIGDPEDITVDRSKLMTSPIDTGQVFSPTQPTTVNTGYDVPITQYPYGAAEGGIIGYNEGGFSGSPHGYGEMDGPFYRGEDEGSAPDIPGLPYDDMMKNMMMKFLQKEFMNNPSAFEQKYGNDTAEFMRQMMGLRTKEQIEKDTGAVFDPESSEIIGYNLNKGGVMDLRGGGFSQGPGTGTSDSIPAMLSDGEFVMTADAVRGAGGGDRREGARRMYEMMDGLEARA